METYDRSLAPATTDGFGNDPHQASEKECIGMSPAPSTGPEMHHRKNPAPSSRWKVKDKVEHVSCPVTGAALPQVQGSTAR
ncbi:hypothetical protein GBZ26_11775 [Azospirillum formosense]|uniref:Uncharacterized protein n=1 Tax=Azospirillum formosense TaxID=861533 RepID=A0ABX2L1B3_9PROT|nr:hypothetical protein [Azospirillum formosense]MBY3755511.1 hypothetical protein [Azospirillum formosense]NUB19891.1 hypothetical protein [Azospirillum formosense]